MVRNRIRTTERAKGWTEHEMNCAIQDVIENGVSHREASRRYDIPLSTLRDRLKTGDCTKVNLGRKPVFTEEQEKEIAEQVILLAKTFYGISAVELRRLVYDYAEAKEIPHTFNRSSKMAGPDWLAGFLKRNQSVSVRKPEATSLNRISAFNAVEVELFFSNLTSVMDIHKFDASRIYNFDETGISTVQKPGKILAPKGAKQVGSATSWERGKNITVCCAVSASGTYVPPMFIFPRQRMTPALERGGPPNSLYQCTKNGWMTEELFPKWLKHFAEFTNASKDNTVLLIMDNHTSHVTLEAYDFCKKNGIVVVTLPPHCSHRLQPLDVTIFSSLKSAFNQECDNFMRSNPHRKITPYDICPIFTKAYIRIANIEKGVSGFRKTGIFPLDPTKFSVDDYVQLIPEEGTALPVVEDDGVRNDETTVVAVPGTSNTATNVVLEDNEPQPTVGVKFKDISPLPGPLQLKRTARQQHSSVFTLTPNKEKLEKAAQSKQEKLQKKQDRASKIPKLKAKPKGQSKYRKFASKVGHNQVDKKKCRRNISFELSSDDDLEPTIRSTADTDSTFKETFKKGANIKQESSQKKQERGRASASNLSKSKLKIKGQSKFRKFESKVGHNQVENKKRRRNISFGSSSEDDLDPKKLCDDDWMDDIDPVDFSGTPVKRSTADGESTCLLCHEFGKNKELWFRCVLCSGWVHSECSGCDTAENFICDFCQIKYARDIF